MTNFKVLKYSIKPFRLIHVIILIIALIIILTDYEYFSELRIENTFAFGSIILLMLNIIRQVSLKLWSKKPFGYLINFIVLFTSLYTIVILLFFLMDYLFVGPNPIPLIWKTAITTNTLIIIFAIIDIATLWKNKNLERLLKNDKKCL